LHRSWGLVRSEAGEPCRFGAALDEAAGSDHLADVDAGAMTSAERAKRSVGDASHRGEYDGRPHLVRADVQRGRGDGWGDGRGGHVGIRLRRVGRHDAMSIEKPSIDRKALHVEQVFAMMSSCSPTSTPERISRLNRVRSLRWRQVWWGSQPRWTAGWGMSRRRSAKR